MEADPLGVAVPSRHSQLRPGAVVWAKVEGHDWWPARVVRRRTVPKEVGPPPGGAVGVMEYIPVVFFTAGGIPGEVEERCDTPAGLVAASLRAMGLGERGCCGCGSSVCMTPVCVTRLFKWMPHRTLLQRQCACSVSCRWCWEVGRHLARQPLVAWPVAGLLPMLMHILPQPSSNNVHFTFTHTWVCHSHSHQVTVVPTTRRSTPGCPPPP